MPGVVNKQRRVWPPPWIGLRRLENPHTPRVIRPPVSMVPLPDGGTSMFLLSPPCQQPRKLRRAPLSNAAFSCPVRRSGFKPECRRKTPTMACPAGAPAIAWLREQMGATARAARSARPRLRLTAGRNGGTARAALAGHHRCDAPRSRAPPWSHLAPVSGPTAKGRPRPACGSGGPGHHHDSDVMPFSVGFS